MGYEAGMFHTQQAKVRDSGEGDRHLRNLWTNALKVLVADACSTGGNHGAQGERRSARAFFISPLHKKDRAYYDMFLGYPVGTVDAIGLKLQATGWKRPGGDSRTFRVQ